MVSRSLLNSFRPLDLLKIVTVVVFLTVQQSPASNIECTDFYSTQEALRSQYTEFKLEDFQIIKEKKYEDGGVHVILKHKWASDVFFNFLVADNTLSLSIKVRGNSTHASNLQNYDGSYRARYRGQDLYDFMMDYLARHKIHFERIKSVWHSGGDLSSNFEKFQENIAREMSNEEAVFDTWTGHQVRRYGFRKIDKFILNSELGSIQVYFARQ